jgi:riboflavin synthase
MFTGIVEQIGSVVDVAEHANHTRLVVSGEGLGGLAIGASIAVSGVCLTAVEVDDTSVTVEVVPETLSRTNLGELTAGGRVNLELPMRANGRFDGHIVQGHVDGTGRIDSLDVTDDGTVMSVKAPPALMAFVVEKGSVTVDGVSLTIATVDDSSFSVALIPHTLEVTTLGLRKPGDTVNLESDVLAKYVQRLLEVRE